MKRRKRQLYETFAVVQVTK